MTQACIQHTHPKVLGKETATILLASSSRTEMYFGAEGGEN